MLINREHFFIKEEILAEAFDKNLKEFDDIVSLLEKSSDKNKLQELLHFRYRNKSSSGKVKSASTYFT
jgi:hypothetical protein